MMGERIKMLSFREWLLKRVDEDSPIGDLASDVKRDRDLPDGEIISYLRNRLGLYLLRYDDRKAEFLVCFCFLFRSVF